MVLLAAEVINLLMRWAHIASAAVLVGGMLYARSVAVPVFSRIENSDERLSLSKRLAQRFRPLIWAAIVGLAVSGFYNFLTHRGHTRYYHVWFGIKVLVALHVFVASLLAVRASEDEARRARRMTGVVISGLIVILIGAYLRRIY